MDLSWPKDSISQQLPTTFGSCILPAPSSAMFCVFVDVAVGVLGGGMAVLFLMHTFVFAIQIHP